MTRVEENVGTLEKGYRLAVDCVVSPMAFSASPDYCGAFIIQKSSLLDELEECQSTTF